MAKRAKKTLAINLTWIHKSELRSLLDCLSEVRAIVPDHEIIYRAREGEASARRAVAILERADRWIERGARLRANMDAR